MNRLIAILLLVSVFGLSSFARDYYVATDGNDTNPGTLAKPFATLEKARDTIRQSKAEALAAGGITVYIRQGSYFRTQSFALTEQDSGEQGKPITYRAQPGEEARLIGGRAVPASAFARRCPDGRCLCTSRRERTGQMPEGESGPAGHHAVRRRSANGAQRRR